MQIGTIAHILVINHRNLFEFILTKGIALETAVDNNNVIISREEFMNKYESYFDNYNIPKIITLLINNKDLEYVWFQK